jgi:glycosyltransferase involved in cell wall biosynthesis
MRQTGDNEGSRLSETFRGNLERCDRDGAVGWAFDSSRPEEPVQLEIRCDGELVGKIVADRYRGDLEAVGYLGAGRCAFDCTWPIPLRAFVEHAIEIVRATDGVPLPNSPVKLPAAAGLDALGREGITKLVREAAQAATRTGDVDASIVYLMQQVDVLLAARSRLDSGERGRATTLQNRWGSLRPSPAVLAAAPPLRPQALFIDDRYPVTGNNSGANAALDHMRALQRLGFGVRFVAARDLSDDNGQAAQLSTRGIIALTAPWYASVEEILSRHAGKLDLIYLHRASNAAGYARLAREYCPQALLVYSVADLHHLRVARQSVVQRRPELERQAHRLRLEELSAARSADMVITHSAAEAESLRRQVPDLTVAVVPWSVPQRATGGKFKARNGVAFIGNFGHEPNLDAVYLLATSVVPALRREAPDICVRVIGSDMPEKMYQMSQPGLEIVGPVEDLGEVFDTVRLTVAPLRFGAGLKGKVVESLAAGVPCIGTSIAYEGIDVPPTLAGCVVEHAGALPSAIQRLYRDQTAYAAAAAAGQRYASEHYGEATANATGRDAGPAAVARRREHVSMKAGLDCASGASGEGGPMLVCRIVDPSTPAAEHADAPPLLLMSLLPLVSKGGP